MLWQRFITSGAARHVSWWLTAGTGNLGVTPAGCTPSFYVLCFGGLPGLEDADTVGISEATVPESVAPSSRRPRAHLRRRRLYTAAV